MVYTAIVCPYMYMGRYCPKEGKNGEKLTFQFSNTIDLTIRLNKITRL